MRYWKKRRNIMAFNRFNPPKKRDLVEAPNLRGLHLKPGYNRAGHEGP